MEYEASKGRIVAIFPTWVERIFQCFAFSTKLVSCDFPAAFYTPGFYTILCRG